MVNDSNALAYRGERPVANINVSLEMELQLAAMERGITPKELAEMAGSHIWAIDGEMCKADLLVWYRTKNAMKSAVDDIQVKHARLRKPNV